MPSLEATVQAHYALPGLLARIDAALAAAGIDPKRPRLQDLQAFDQLHGFGIRATEAHADRAGITAGMRVLDLGCGLGGASRYLAAVLGAQVSAIDLTPDFVEIARELTSRCGLEGIEFRQANALALPFEDRSFDHVWCHNVTMNIGDKDRLVREVARVLRPQGRFSCVEVEQGPAGAPRFPLPWAREPSSSFLVTPEAMRAVIERAGFRILEQAEFRAELMRQGQPPRQQNSVANGDDYPTRIANSNAGLEERRLVDTIIVAAMA
jgi:ubiquinone/menaquinone biosynthesis C-methylase UbiE